MVDNTNTHLCLEVPTTNELGTLEVDVRGESCRSCAEMLRAFFLRDSVLSRDCGGGFEELVATMRGAFEQNRFRAFSILLSMCALVC